jgi:hypothetical protein
MARTNFTDFQKAEIFVRDRALCAFSGVSLWLLDSGTSGYYMIDWVDHVKPACGGGTSTLDNGVCASWIYNFAKGRSPDPGVQLFCRGIPTEKFFLLRQVLTAEQVEHITRFSKLHTSDWFFNRAIWHVCLGLSWLSDSARGQRRSRDDLYYSKAAFRTIATWRKLITKHKVPSLETRGLVPKRMSQDQRLLLSIRRARSVGEVGATMKKLFPFHRSNQAAFDCFLGQLWGNANKKQTDAAFMRSLKADRYITPVVRERIVANARLVFS